MASTGKIAEVLFENALQTYEQQMQMLKLVERFEPDSGNMQNGGNFVWRPVQQHAPVIEGWDLTGQETEIVEETYPAILGLPKNDFFSQRADDLRDMRFWERRGEESGRKQATTLNAAIAAAINLQGSLFYRTNAASGYDAIAEAQTILNEREKRKDEDRFMILNDRDNLKYGKDLAGRQTIQGRPDDTWETGMVGMDVAGFDVYTGAFNPTIAAGGTPVNGAITSLSGGTLASGGQSFIPEGGTVNATTGVVTNVDYRSAVINVTDAGTLAVGDKITISGVNAVALADKSDTGQLMTFTIVGVAANALTVYPKPISSSLVDATDQALYRAYANCTGDVSAGTVSAALNVTAAKTNVFGCKGSVEVTSGDAPLELLNQFGGMKVISSAMENGQSMYMAYDGNIDDLSFKCRLFTWWAVTVADPGACGSFTTF